MKGKKKIRYIKSSNELHRFKGSAMLVTQDFNMLVEGFNKKQMEVVDELFVHYHNQMAMAYNKEGAMATLASFQQHIDKLLSNHFKGNSAEVTCFKAPKGCSFCCYINCDILPAEGSLILEYLEDHPEVEVAWDRMAKQVAPPNTHKYPDSLPYADRRCAFLQKDNTCGIYEARPISCRVHHVKSPVEACNTEDNSRKQTIEYHSLEIEVIKSLLLMLFSKNNAMQNLATTILSLS